MPTSEKHNDQEMTLDKLALMMGQGFNEVHEKFREVHERINNAREELKMDMTSMESRLRNDFITSSDKVVGELQEIRQEHASSFGLY